MVNGNKFGKIILADNHSLLYQSNIAAFYQERQPDIWL